MKSKKKFIAVVLARGGSKEIKLKNLTNINKKPLLYWTLRACKKSQFIKNIWISSDHKAILEYSKKNGALIIKRPKKLAKDYSTSLEGIYHALKFINQYDKDYSNVIFLQATSPIRNSSSIDKAIKYYNKLKYDSLFSSQEIKDFFIWKKIKGKIKADHNYKNRLPRQKLEIKYLENGSIYIFKKKLFLKKRTLFAGKVGTFVMKKIESFQLDDLEDKEIINYLMSKKTKL